MKFKLIEIVCVVVLLVIAGVYVYTMRFSTISGAPPYGIAEEDVPEFGTLDWLRNWQRPDGPVRVGLQVGHWKSSELPEELERIRGNTGATGGGMSEWEVNYAIVQELRTLLIDDEIVVDVLPATVPPGYWADVFISIHADGSEDPAKRGFKIARPWRDFTRRADSLVSHLEQTYEAATRFELDPVITRNMRGYYAFSWWRFDHAIHPMTTAVIVETGFLTNLSDQQLLINTPEISARGIYDGLIQYLNQEGLLNT